MSRVFLLTIGNETNESIKSITTVEGVETMLGFINMVGLVGRFITNSVKAHSNSTEHEVDNTDDEEFKKFMIKQGVRL